MKHRLLSLLVLIGLMALSVTVAWAAPPIKVVALYNLTGGMSSLDAPSLNGAKLKAKEINQAGGLLNGREIQIKAIDTKTDQKEAATAARRAVGMSNVVAGIGYSDTTYVLAAAPQFQNAGIPFLTSGATAPALPKMVGGGLFLVPFGDNVQARAMANYAYKKLNMHDIAVWTDNGMDYTKGLSKFFRKRYKQLGGKIALNDYYMTGDRDFSAQVSRLKSKADNLDGVYIAAGPNEAGVIVKQIREAGIKLPIMGGDGFDTPLVSKVPGKKLATDVMFTTHAFAGEHNKQVQKFRTDFKKTYGHKPPNAFAALGYDAVGLLADAIKRAGSTSHDAVKKALANTHDYNAVTGRIEYSQGSHVPLKPVAVMQVKHGKFSLLTTVTPSGG